MRFKKLNEVNNFGQFENFKWPNNLNEFGKYNFFYGWNYSGKTTISRIFRCFELKQLHEDYQNASFKLETDSGFIKETDLNSEYPIRVFNEDFIEENFDWNNENAEIEPVLILGKESKELEEELKQKQKEKSDKENELKKINEDRRRNDRELQDKLTAKASEIRNILSITNPREFDKNNLEKVINDIKDNFLEKVLSDEKLQQYKNTINSQKLDHVSLPDISLNLTKFLNDVKEILEKKVSAQQIIEKLNQNARLSNWVREGIELHKEETMCQFCGNKLTTERIAELNKHFSKEFDDFINLIKQKENEINNHLSEIDKYSLPDKARFYNQFQNKYEELVKSYNQLKLEYIENDKKLINELNKKKEKPFNELIIDQNINIKVEKVENELIELLEKIQNLISKHNDTSNTLEGEKNQAKEKIKLHHVAIFIQDEQYFKKKQDIDHLNNDIQRIESEIETLKREISNIENKIKATAIGTQRLNELLNKFFNDDRLKIENTSNGKYKIYRNNQIAKNLSTGERNIISLVYFFTKLEDLNFDFSNAVIFIDDPVSSLDANHIHAVYAFLFEKIKNINQIFITTHNFDFFNLLKDLYTHDLGNKEGNFYFIKRIQNNQTYSSTIENLPESLKKFKSEYNYLFYTLKTFNDSNTKSSFEQIYILPNILRRFFEMYLFMKYPDGKRFSVKAEKLFKNTDQKDKIMALKIMDEYSHEQNPQHSLRFPDLQELIVAVDFVLKSIENKDTEHYRSLCDSIN